MRKEIVSIAICFFTLLVILVLGIWIIPKDAIITNSSYGCAFGKKPFSFETVEVCIFGNKLTLYK